MPYFLTQNDLYRLLQRELPEGVFPDGAPSAFFHTAEMYSYAKNISSAYGNASGIYQNFFPQSCDENAIGQWETRCFGAVVGAGETLAVRQAAVLAYMRSSASGISKAAITALINRTIPGLNFEIIPWNTGQAGGGWILDVSQLDFDTYLNYDAQFAGPVGPGLCGDAPSKWFLTAQQWAYLQTMAYTYEVRIFFTTLTASQRAILTAALNTYGPVRSPFVINDGLTAADMITLYPNGWNPSYLPTVDRWYDMTDPAARTLGGSNVTNLVDKVNANNATAVSGGPTVLPANQNGKDVLAFSGTQNLTMPLVGTYRASGFTVGLVAKVVTVDTQNRPFFNIVTSDGFPIKIACVSLAAYKDIAFGDITLWGIQQRATFATLSAWNYFVLIYDGVSPTSASSYTLRINGVTVPITGTGAGFGSSPLYPAIGYAGATGIPNFIGDMMHLVFCKTGISGFDLVNLESYLKTQGGL